MQVGGDPKVRADTGDDVETGRFDNQVGTRIDRRSETKPERSPFDRDAGQLIDVVPGEDQPRGVRRRVVDDPFGLVQQIVGRPHRIAGQQQLVKAGVLRRTFGRQSGRRIVLDEQLVFVEVDQDLVTALLQRTVFETHDRLRDDRFDLRAEPQIELDTLDPLVSLTGHQKVAVEVP